MKWGKSGLFLLLNLLSARISVSSVENQEFRKDDTPCPAVTTPPDFNLNLYTSKRWYVHQLAPTQYVPVERNYCAYADYSILEKKTFPWSYELSVSNYAENKEREQFGGPLCGFVDDPDNQAKLKVAPCFLPKSVAGPYWVLAHDETKGYALISGGQPSIRTDSGCITGDGVNDSGLWIFLRTRERNDSLIEEVREVARKFEIDLSVLNDVDQTNCSHGENLAEN